MQNLSRLLAFLFLLILVSACDKDEKGIPDNTLRYDGKSYKLKFALGENYGFFEEGGVTYSNTDFIFLDREIDVEDTEPVFTHGLYIEMYSAGSEIFQGGKFSYYDGSGPVPDGSVFTEAALFFYDDDFDPIFAEDGEIKVTISGDHYEFVFDLITEDGKKLEGKFSGEIQIENIGEPNVSGSIDVEGDDRDSDFGEIIDYGSDGSHYNYDFYIYDAEETYELYFEAFSLGTSGFQAGTFNYGTTGSSYFNQLNFYDYNSESFYEAVAGSVVVTKLTGAREYRLNFNVELEGDYTLSGIVEGNFDYSGPGGRIKRTKDPNKSGRYGAENPKLDRIPKYKKLRNFAVN